jgi:hypothetical protein
MVQDQFYDLLDDSGHLRVRAWRCVCCGNVLDRQILSNRLRQRRALLLQGPVAA